MHSTCPSGRFRGIHPLLEYLAISVGRHVESFNSRPSDRGELLILPILSTGAEDGTKAD